MPELCCGAADALARLRVRRTLDCVLTHPADLDDALCAGATVVSDSGKLRLPFAVDDTVLLGARGVLWAVRHNHPTMIT